MSSINLASAVELATTTNNTGGVFFGCTSLTSVDIGANCTTIGRYAFRNCSALATFIVRRAGADSTQITSLAATDVFQNTPSTMKIYVPDASVDIYKAAANWSTYASRIYGLSELPA